MVKTPEYEPNGNGRAAATRILWWVVGALFTVTTLGIGVVVGDVARRLGKLEDIALTRLPEHAEFRAGIASNVQRIESIESFRDTFRDDVRNLTRELSAVREQMAVFSTTLLGIRNNGKSP